MSRTLAAVADELHVRLIGDDVNFGAVTIDTRSLDSGGLFVAIEGEHASGNDFVSDAHEKGAAGALVSRRAEIELPQVKVDDTRKAFGQMARAWRDNFPIPVVAVTGSNGKTTVKELIASILTQRRSVCVTQGNLNNDLGVPLTLMTLHEGHEALIAELGANHAGEIDYLSGLVQPTVGVITNANAAHLEGFLSLDGVATAKGELLDHLPRAGTAVLNFDDPYFSDWRARSHADSVLSFGFGSGADCTVVGDISEDVAGCRFTMQLPEGERADIELPLVGRHNVLNALAAAAVAFAVGTAERDIVDGLYSAHAVKGRLNVLRGKSGAAVIDDSYNANPASVKAALDYLSSASGKRILILGDMAELGPEAVELHSEIGRYAADRCDALMTLGELSRNASEAFGSGASAFDDVDNLAAAVEDRLADDVTILIKGSRVMELDRLVHLLVSNEVAAC